MLLLWSVSDKDYLAKLAAIQPDASAGRAARDHLFPLKRLHDNIAVMERAVEMVRKDQLTLTRFPIAEINCKLSPTNLEWLERWQRSKVAGKKSLELLPFALWWLQEHRQQPRPPDNQLIMWSRSRTHRIHLGRPSLGWLLHIFKDRRQVKRQCLLPHIKSGEQNELLAFERGSKWKEADLKMY